VTRPIRKLALAVLMALVLLAAGGARQAAAVEPVIPADHEEFFSGGAIGIDPSALAPGPTSATGTGRPARVGPNTQVNAPQQRFPAGLLGRSETTIASTADGQELVAGFNDAQGFCGPPFGSACTPQSPPGLSGFAFSTDGGLTWTDGGAPPVIGHVFTRGDPWLDRGGLDGTTIYYANLAVNDQTGADLGVSVHRGHFSTSGFSWKDVHTFNAPNAPHDFYDKEAIAAAKDGSGAAYVSLTNFIQTCGIDANGFGQIEVWRTHDGGDSWQGPVVVSPDQTFITDPANPACGTTGTLQQSSAPAVGPLGELYVAWQFGPTFTAAGTSTDAQIRLARSLDGGSSFDPPVIVSAINSMRQDAPVGYNRDRINDHPRVAVATSGPHNGRVYVAYYSAVAPVAAAPITPCATPPAGFCRGQQLTSSQAFVKFSDDQGATWSTAVPVGPPVPATGVKRWWPVVSVEPGGNVDVVFYESQETPTSSNPVCNVRVGSLAGQPLWRRGAANSLVDTFWAQSTDGGATFSAPMRVSSATSNWCTTASNIRPNFGDYIGSTSTGNRVLATWADGRNGVPDVFFAAGLGSGKGP
jgi:hypothetical protein